jgi:hypothetical protein
VIASSADRPSPAARRRSAEAAEAWRASPLYRAAENVLGGVAPDDVDGAREAATLLLSDADWAGALLAPLVRALADEPLLEPPLRVQRDAGRLGVVLFDAPAVRVSAAIITAHEVSRQAPPPRVVVTGRVAVTRYLRAGGAVFEQWTAEPADDTFTQAAAGLARCTAILRPRDGEVSALDGRVAGQRLIAASHDVVTLSAVVRAPAPFLREYDTGSGRLVRAATTDDGASRAAMLLAFLRASGGERAGVAFGVATRDPAFHLRWSAMRDWLVADAPAALPCLAEMADTDPHPDVRAAARATLARITVRRAA